MKESYKELQDRFTQKYNELYQGYSVSFRYIITALLAGIEYARNRFEFFMKETHSEDDFTLCKYYAKILDTYLRTVDELDLAVLFVSDCAVKNTWSEERNPMIVENADDYIYTPTLNSENKDPLPLTAEQTTDKSDDKDLLKDNSNSIIPVHIKCEGSILGSLPILISSWCELNNLNKATTFHIVSELFRNMYEALESFDFRKED